MAQDGSYEVTWAGRAFPYLMHHPNSFLKTENYGSAKSGGHGNKSEYSNQRDDTTTSAGTGTWNGTAPRGDPNRAANEEALRVKALVINEPTSVRLSDGSSMPITGLGTGAPGLTAETIKSALAMGYRHFDCAWFYKNEAVVGEGLKAFIDEGKRSELYICSKVWNTHHRPASVRESAEQSIAELGCGYLDLLLVHWPEAWIPLAPGAGDSDQILGPELPEVDTEASLQTMWETMEALVTEGKVKSLGVANFNVKQVEDLLSFCKVKPVVNQVELHPMNAQRKLVGVCYRKGIQCVAYSPLGSSGFLIPNDLIDQPAVKTVMQQTGKSAAQVLLKWNTQRGVVVIPRSTNEGRMRENLEGMSKWKFTNEQKALMDGLNADKRYITFPWKNWGNPEEGGVAKPSLNSILQGQ